MGGWVAAGLSLVAVAVLCGCQAESDTPTVAPDPSTTQVFQNKNEAADAAEKSYNKYAQISDLIAADGGAGLERLSPYVTAAELRDEEAGAKYLADNGLRIVGQAKLVKFQVQSADLVVGKVAAYACTDVSKSRVLNATGEDVTPSKRQDRQTSVAQFVWQDGRLLLNKTSPWFGESLC